MGPIDYWSGYAGCISGRSRLSCPEPWAAVAGRRVRGREPCSNGKKGAIRRKRGVAADEAPLNQMFKASAALLQEYVDRMDRR